MTARRGSETRVRIDSKSCGIYTWSGFGKVLTVSDCSQPPQGDLSRDQERDRQDDIRRDWDDPIEDEGDRPEDV